MKVERPQGNQVATQVASYQMSSPVEPVAAEALAEGANTLINTGLDVYDEVATASATETLNAFKDAKRKVLFDPDNGYFNTQGKDAYANAQGVADQLQSMKDEYGGGLSALARQKFTKVASRELDQDFLNIDRHAAQGVQVWQQKENQLSIENAITDAYKLGKNPEQLMATYQTGQLQVLEQAQDNGWGDDVAAANLELYTSRYFAAAVRGQMATDTDAARALFEEVGDRIQGQEYSQIQAEFKQRAEQAARVAQARTEDARQSDWVARIQAAHPDDLQAQLDAATNAPGDIQEGVFSELSYRYRQYQNAQQYASTAAYEDALGFLHDNEGATMADFGEMYRDKYSLLSNSQVENLESRDVPAPNPDRLVDILTAPAEVVAQLDPSAMYEVFPPDQARRAVDQITESRRVVQSGGPEPELDPAVGRSFNSRIQSIVEQLYGSEDGRSEEENLKAKVARRTANQMAIDLAQDGKLTAHDISRIEDAITDPVEGTATDPSQLFGYSIPFTGGTEASLADVSADKQKAALEFLDRSNITATPERIVVYATGGIPERDKQEISQWLVEQGLPVTKENIYNAYFQAQE